jgi:hypothetical protein
MKKLKYILLGAALMGLFFYNPPKESYYDAVLKKENKLGVDVLSGLKHTVVAGFYEYENYYLCGILRKKKDDSIVFLGIAGFIIPL